MARDGWHMANMSIIEMKSIWSNDGVPIEKVSYPIDLYFHCTLFLFRILFHANNFSRRREQVVVLLSGHFLTQEEKVYLTRILNH